MSLSAARFSPAEVARWLVRGGLGSEALEVLLVGEWGWDGKVVFLVGFSFLVFGAGAGGVSVGVKGFSEAVEEEEEEGVRSPDFVVVAVDERGEGGGGRVALEWRDGGADIVDAVLVGEFGGWRDVARARLTRRVERNAVCATPVSCKRKVGDICVGREAVEEKKESESRIARTRGENCTSSYIPVPNAASIIPLHFHPTR